MANIDVASTKWRAIRAMFEANVRLHWIAAVAGCTERFIMQIAVKYGWTVRPSTEGPAETLGEADDPQGIRRNLMAAVSRRFGALALDEAGSEEALARSMAALVKTTDAAARLAEAFARGGEGDGARRPEEREVRESLRAKLARFAAGARPERTA